MLSITSVMVLPAYLASCAYLWKLCIDGEYPNNLLTKRSNALLTAVFGSIYALWLIYAAGLKYLMLAAVIIALGIPVYIWARKEHTPQACPFNRDEKWFAGILIAVAIAAVYGFSHGLINLN